MGLCGNFALDKPVYIMGDLKCNLLSTECRESKSLTSFYESFNLSQLIAAPTRVTESPRSLLDVILASQTKQVVKAGVMDSSISDHDMVCVSWKINQFQNRIFG